jgi:microcin C transport system permease protein
MFYKYIFKRLLLIIPNLFIILTLNFLIIQSAPGGPVEKFIAQINHVKINNEVIDNNINNAIYKNFYNENSSKYQGSQGIDPELIKQIEKNYGFDLPLFERFYLLLKKFLVFDFGESFYQDKKIIDLIKEKIPVSISLGLWTVLLTYLIAIPLGIKKAINNKSRFDISSTSIIIVLHAIPAFLLSIFFIILFCGGNFLNIFPLKGLVSENFNDLNWLEKIPDYFWHLILPILSMTLGGFASLTFFTKNSFLEEINKNYVLCAKAKGLKIQQILYFHIFRNYI